MSLKVKKLKNAKLKLVIQIHMTCDENHIFIY